MKEEYENITSGKVKGFENERIQVHFEKAWETLFRQEIEEDGRETQQRINSKVEDSLNSRLKEFGLE